MGFLVMHEGKFYDLPFDYSKRDHPARRRFPNRAMIRLDERDFKAFLADHPEWVTGTGNSLQLSFCKSKLTITRHRTWRKALESKAAIDGGGCRGLCLRVHIPGQLNPRNSHYHRPPARNSRVHRSPLRPARPIERPKRHLARARVYEQREKSA
jgi:hypothetical protein